MSTILTLYNAVFAAVFTAVFAVVFTAVLLCVMSEQPLTSHTVIHQHMYRSLGRSLIWQLLHFCLLDLLKSKSSIFILSVHGAAYKWVCFIGSHTFYHIPSHCWFVCRNLFSVNTVRLRLGERDKAVTGSEKWRATSRPIRMWWSGGGRGGG